jgi:hypothetical protein
MGAGRGDKEGEGKGPSTAVICGVLLLATAATLVYMVPQMKFVRSFK